MTTWDYSRFRDRALTSVAGALSHARRPLWYAEVLVLSARYQQWLSMNAWSASSRRYHDRLRLWQAEVEPRVRQTPSAVLEFGVAEGRATYWWADRQVPFVAWHGFDTFAGLPDDWTRADIPVMAEGVFKPTQGAGREPRPHSNFPYSWHRGLIEETLTSFTRPDNRLFVLIDVDLLGPTETILEWLANNGRPGDLVYFDEAFDPWNEGLAIRKALNDGLLLRGIAYTGSALLVEIVEAPTRR